MSIKSKEKLVIGWREWVALPDLDIKLIKAKIDTGARSSSLHATEIKLYIRGGKEFVKFKVHPEQRNSKKVINASSKVLEYRKVKSSNGITEKRPVILTEIELMGQKWPIELTLTNVQFLVVIVIALESVGAT